MKRLEFLAVLGALPLVGKLFAEYKPPRPARETDTFFRAQSRVFKAAYERSYKSIYPIFPQHGFTTKDGTRFWIPDAKLEQIAREVLESEYMPRSNA